MAKPSYLCSPATLARRAKRIAQSLCIGQSISAIHAGREFRACAFRVIDGRLYVRDLHGDDAYLPVDLEGSGRPRIFDERGSHLV